MNYTKKKVNSVQYRFPFNEIIADCARDLAGATHGRYLVGMDQQSGAYKICDRKLGGMTVMTFANDQAVQCSIYLQGMIFAFRSIGGI
jgi:hypothetical protein